MTFHPDACSYELDQFHALACYVIAGGGTSHSPDPELAGVSWMFPAFVNMSDGGASKKATRILKNLVGKVADLTDEMTSHGLRVGSTDDMAENTQVHIIEMTATACVPCRKSIGRLE